MKTPRTKSSRGFLLYWFYSLNGKTLSYELRDVKVRILLESQKWRLPSRWQTRFEPVGYEYVRISIILISAKKKMENIWLDEEPLLKSGNSEKSGLWVRVPRSPLTMVLETTTF